MICNISLPLYLHLELSKEQLVMHFAPYIYLSIHIFIYTRSGSDEGKNCPSFHFSNLQNVHICLKDIRVNYKSLYVLYILRENIYVKKRILHPPISLLPQHSELKHIIDDLLDPQVIRFGKGQ